MRPQSTRHSFPTARRALLGLGITLALTVVTSSAFAPRAEACGMGRFYGPRRNAAALLAQARRELDEDRNISALLTAKSVLDSNRGNAAERAEAWSIVGWVRWQRGQHDTAVEAMEKGRALDKKPLDHLLLLFADDATEKAVRKALGT